MPWNTKKRSASMLITSAMWQSGPSNLPGAWSLLTMRLAVIRLAFADTFVHVLKKMRAVCNERLRWSSQVVDAATWELTQGWP